MLTALINMLVSVLPDPVMIDGADGQSRRAVLTAVDLERDPALARPKLNDLAARVTIGNDECTILGA